jgi:hypothetical protein
VVDRGGTGLSIQARTIMARVDSIWTTYADVVVVANHRTLPITTVNRPGFDGGSLVE